eukprot:2290884-Rhodomonas_salina.1
MVFNRDRSRVIARTSRTEMTHGNFCKTQEALTLSFTHRRCPRDRRNLQKEIFCRRPRPRPCSSPRAAWTARNAGSCQTISMAQHQRRKGDQMSLLPLRQTRSDRDGASGTQKYVNKQQECLTPLLQPPAENENLLVQSTHSELCDRRRDVSQNGRGKVGPAVRGNIECAEVVHIFCSDPTPAQ